MCTSVEQTDIYLDATMVDLWGVLMAFHLAVTKVICLAEKLGISLECLMAIHSVAMMVVGWVDRMDAGLAEKLVVSLESLMAIRWAATMASCWVEKTDPSTVAMTAYCLVSMKDFGKGETKENLWAVWRA